MASKILQKTFHVSLKNYKILTELKYKNDFDSYNDVITYLIKESGVK